MSIPHIFTTWFLLAGLVMCRVVGWAQSIAPPDKRTQGYVEAGGFVVSGPMPFWLRANQAGVVPIAGSTGTLRVGINRNYRPISLTDSLVKARKVDWGYGVNLVGNTGQRSQLLLQEAYLKVRLGQFELYAGRRREQIGLVDTLLTSGSYAWSGNALPIPKIQFSTRGYVALPFTRGLVAINALYGDGWFENVNKRVTNTHLHQAALYVRVGKPSGNVKFHLGLNHQVVWGGYAADLSNGVSNNGQLPSSFKAYLYAVAALPASSLDTDPNVSNFDGENRIGNHLGSLDIGAEITLPTGRLLLYRQNPYDTGALFYLTTIADGLNGLSFRRHEPGTGWLTVDGAVLEWLFTKSQGGSFFVIDDPALRGKVNYFNNSQYVDGWQYYGRTIGTPFLTPQTEVNPNLPVGYPIANNRVSLWHIGVSGRLAQKVQWLTKLSYSQNAGSYDVPYAAGTNQFSALLTLSAPLPVLGGVLLNASVAVDTGKLLTNSSGCYVGLRKPINRDKR